MTGPDHYRKAEELTAKAHEYLGQGDGEESAAVWAAVHSVRLCWWAQLGSNQ